MKNDIISYQNPDTLKYGAALYSYEETPSGNIRPILRLSVTAEFSNSVEARNVLWDILPNDIKDNTNYENKI